MSKDSASRRAWIKNAAIVFLVILLLLTFFSKTILEYSLPQVSAQYAQYGTLSTAIKVSGTVKANASYNVVYEADAAEAADGVVQSRKVISVFVKEGQTVEKDAPILELKGGPSEQLDTLQKEYDEKKKNYDLALLDDEVKDKQSDKSLSDAQRSLVSAKDELAKMQKNYNDLISGVDVTSIIEEQIDALEDEIEALTENQTEIESNIASVQAKIDAAQALIEEDILSTLSISEKLAIAEEDYNIAESSYNTLKREVDFYKERLDELKSVSGDVSEANTLTQTLKTAQKNLDNLEKERERYIEDYYYKKNEELEAVLKKIKEIDEQIYELLYSDSTIPVSDGEETDETSTGGDTSVGVTLTKEEQIANLTKQREQYEKQADELRNYDSEDIAYARKLEDYDDQIAELETQINDIKAKLEVIGMPEVDDVVDYTVDYDLAAAQKDYDDASAKFTEAEKTYTEAKTKYESLTKQSAAEGTVAEYTTLLENYKAEKDAVKDELKNKNKELDDLKDKLSDSTQTMKPEDLEAQIKEKKNSIAELESQLELTKATVTQSDASTKIQREADKKALDELAAKIEKYKNAPENTQVTAPIAGKIVSVNVTAGESVTSGNTVASIEIADKGYVCEITMPAEQARKVQVGSPCSIVNSWWYSNIEASVTAIRSDPQSQGKNRIIVITVTGDVSEGQSLNFSIGDKSQSYDSVLPNSAIREDNDGKFVLVVESKSTPLGVRYTARRANIEVLASDDTKSAVSGLYGSEFVITSSETPISDKQQVRLAEN